MIIIIENLKYIFKYNSILFLDSRFYDINKDKLISFILYSKILGLNLPSNLSLLEIIIDDCFEIINFNHKNVKYYYSFLINILLEYWNSSKLFFLLNKYQDYSDYIDYKKIINSENKETLILFYYFIKNLSHIEYKYNSI
jgi:hypothetical protein